MKSKGWLGIQKSFSNVEKFFTITRLYITFLIVLCGK